MTNYHGNIYHHTSDVNHLFLFNVHDTLGCDTRYKQTSQSDFHTKVMCWRCLIYLRRWPNPSPIFPVKGVSIIRLSQEGWFLFGTNLEDLIMLSRFEGETSEGILLAILSLDWECFDGCNFHGWLLLSIMKYRLMAFISRARGYDVFFVAFVRALPLWDGPGDIA